MSVDKLVSIIIPAFNAERYIHECIESVLGQTYSNIEAIVVDDGSKDRTWDIICQLARRDVRIKAFRQENKGVSAARNQALEMVKGEYCGFVDADDYLEKNAVEKLVQAIESSDADWVSFGYHRIDDNSRHIGNSDFVTGFIDFTDESTKFSFVRDTLITYRVGYEVWLKLFRTELIKSNNLYFRPECSMGEDLEFCMRYCMIANNILCIDELLYFYRESISSSMSIKCDTGFLFEQRLSISIAFQDVYKKGFSDIYIDKYYQIFFKLMLYACLSCTIKEVIYAAEVSDNRDYYNMMLHESILHKDRFSDFFPSHVAKFYWRVGYYIWSEMNNDIKGKCYFAVYNFLRKTSGRISLENWKWVNGK